MSRHESGTERKVQERETTEALSKAPVQGQTVHAPAHPDRGQATRKMRTSAFLQPHKAPPTLSRDLLPKNTVTNTGVLFKKSNARVQKCSKEFQHLAWPSASPWCAAAFQHPAGTGLKAEKFMDNFISLTPRDSGSINQSSNPSSARTIWGVIRSKAGLTRSLIGSHNPSEESA